ELIQRIDDGPVNQEEVSPGRSHTLQSRYVPHDEIKQIGGAHFACRLTLALTPDGPHNLRPTVPPLQQLRQDLGRILKVRSHDHGTAAVSVFQPAGECKV